MKIIAKYKDYYDFLQGIYGVDEKLVYDRRDGVSINERTALLYPQDGDRVVISAAGKTYPAIFHEGKWSCKRESFVKFFEDKKPKKRVGLYRRTVDSPPKWYDKVFEASTDLNAIECEPVLIKSPSYKTSFKPSLLSDYGIASVLSPEQAFINISAFLGWMVDNPPLPDILTDKEKVVSHGFDLKTSFRHR